MAAVMARPSSSSPPSKSSQVKAPWMTPGAPRVAKPSWLRLAVPEAPEPAPPPVEVIPSVPPRSVRQPSLPPPPSSRRVPPAQIQTTREVELESEVVQLHDELQRVLAESASMRARVMEESEPAIVALALAIAKRVVGREIEGDPALLHAWVREARGLLPSGEVFVASDVEMEGATTDASLAAGSAEVRDGASTIAVGVDARMAAMADALGVER
jgi:hypothetical protein